MNEFGKMMHTLFLQCLGVLVSGVPVVGSAAPAWSMHQRNIKQPTLSGDGYAMLHPTIPRRQEKLEIIHSSKQTLPESKAPIPFQEGTF